MKTSCRALLLLAAALPLSCAGVDLPTAKGGQVLEAGTFTLVAPPGEWNVDVNRAADAVVLLRVYHWLGHEAGRTTMSIYRWSTAASRELGDESAIADDYLRGVEQFMAEEGRASGDYRLHDIARGMSLKGDMRLYWMEYAQTMTFMKHGLLREHGVLYVWVPPDVVSAHAFYVFHLAEQYQPGALVGSDDPTQIDPVIGSFRLKRAGASAVRP